MATKREVKDSSTERLRSPRNVSSSSASAPRSNTSKPGSSSGKSPTFDVRAIREALPKSRTSKHGKPTDYKPILRRSSQADSRFTNLHLDVLSKCFLKLDSVFQILTCAAVCKAWREASMLDVIWKEIYFRWHVHEPTFQLQQRAILPSGCISWRQAFILNFSEGRTLVFERTVSKALEAGLLQRRFNNVLDFTPAASFQTLAEDLQLSFYIRINNAQQIRLKGSQAVLFPASCILHCPVKLSKRELKLSSLVSLEVVVSSDRLTRSHSIASFKTGKNSHWRIDGLSATPLRLLQHSENASTTLIVGTLLESMNTADNPSIEHEEIIFIKVGIHLSEVISKFLKRCGTTLHRIRPDPDPTYGLHGYHVSVQLHTFEKLIWTRMFHGAFWNMRESIPGETAVLLLIPSFELVSAKLSLPWRSQAFAGEVENSLLGDITLWDSASESVWQAVEIFQLKPVSLPTVEYSLPEFEGSQFEATVADSRRGISASMKCSIPIYSPEPLFAITDLRLSLSKSFLLEWFGVSNI